MVKKSYLFGIIFILVLTVSCSSILNLNKNENWKYPKSKYITAIGTGQTQEKAKKNALAQISEFFDVSVKSVSLFKDSATRENKENVYSSSTAIDLTNSYSSFFNLSAVKIENMQQDEQGTFSCLAVLNKSDQVHIFNTELLEYENQIDMHLKEASNSSSIFQKLNHLEKAKIAALQERQLKTYIFILNGKKQKDSLVMIETQIMETIKNQSIALEVNMKENNSTLYNNLSTQLIDKGFMIDKNSPIKITIDLTYDLSKDPNNQFYLATYQSNIKVTEQNSLTYNKTNNGKGAGITQEKAIEKALKKASIWIIENIGN